MPLIGVRHCFKDKALFYLLILYQVTEELGAVGGACLCAEPLQSCLTLYDPVDYRLAGCSVHGILQERILEWVSMPSSRGSSQLRDQTHVSHVSCIGRWVLYHQHHLGSLRITLLQSKPDLNKMKFACMFIYH